MGLTFHKSALRLSSVGGDADSDDGDDVAGYGVHPAHPQHARQPRHGPGGQAGELYTYYYYYYYTVLQYYYSYQRSSIRTLSDGTAFSLYLIPIVIQSRPNTKRLFW